MLSQQYNHNPDHYRFRRSLERGAVIYETVSQARFRRMAVDAVFWTIGAMGLLAMMWIAAYA